MNDLPQMSQFQQGSQRPSVNNSYANRSMISNQQLPVNDKPQFTNIGPFGNHYTIDSTAGSIAGTGIGFNDLDNKSVSSKQSKLSKFTYSEYPQIKPTNPLYNSTNTLKTAASQASRASRASTMNTVSRRQKYNPNQPRRIQDLRWTSALAVLFFFPSGLISLGLAIKAQTKFNDGFIDEAKKLNRRAFIVSSLSFFFGAVWILTMFFLVDKWPRTNG